MFDSVKFYKRDMSGNKIRIFSSLLYLLFSHCLFAESALINADSLSKTNYQYIKDVYSNISQLDIDSNRIKLNKVLTLSRVNGDKSIEVDIYNLLGDYYKRISVSDSTLKYYKKALDIAVKVDYNKYFPSIGYNIANSYWLIGNYSQALEMALQLKNFYDVNGKIEEQAHLINLLGIIYLKLLDFSSALENLEHAARICEEKNNMGLLGVVYANIGNLYYRMKQYPESIKYYEKGVKLEIDNKEFTGAGRSYEAIANLYLEMGELERVEPLLENALHYNALSADLVGQLRTFSTYGKYYNSIEEHAKAIKYLEEAEKIAIKSDSKEYYMKTCEQFSIAYRSLNNHLKALYYQDKYLSLYKQIYNIQEFSNIKKLEHELRIEKKNNEIVKIEIEKKRYVNALLLVVIILSFTIGALFMLMYLRSIRTKKSLLKMNQEITIQKEYLEKTNIELDEARKTAESANELKGHFLRNITHEIRTPLNGIIGISEVIVNNKSADNKLECLQMIKDNSSKLISTIDNLVEMAHITSKQVITQVEYFNPKLFLDDLYQEYLTRFDYCKGKVEFNILNNLDSNIQLKTDSRLLRKIIEQLIENSIKFTKEGRISIGCKREQNHLHFFVQDTGIGISKDSQTKIFESFRQEQEGSIREFEGVGIGLTIAKKLSEILGAELWFESKKDQGTTFFVTFHLELN